MKKAVKKSCTEWRVNGNAASRDCHQLPETEAAEEEPVRRQHDQRTHIKSGISGSWFLESMENAQQQCFCDASSGLRMVRALLQTTLKRAGTTILARVGWEGSEWANGRDQISEQKIVVDANSGDPTTLMVTGHR